MQELPNSTETNCHQVPQAGADTNQTRCKSYPTQQKPTATKFRKQVPIPIRHDARVTQLNRNQLPPSSASRCRYQSDTMQELPNSTETNCHQVPQAGADTNQTVQEPTQAEVTESTATNGTNVANGATASVKPKKKR